MEEFVGIGQLQIKDPGSHANDGRGYNQVWSNGLTKREYFAVKILQGLLSYGDGESNTPIENAPASAVNLANRLIEELKK